MPTQPVYAGEIQAPHLGVAACAFNRDGESVIDEVGELVVTEPMPSMPARLWGDAGDGRYKESYFADFPGSGARATSSASTSGAAASCSAAPMPP